MSLWSWVGDGGEGGKRRNRWKNSSEGCIYPGVRAKWDGVSPRHWGINEVHLCLEGITDFGYRHSVTKTTSSSAVNDAQMWKGTNLSRIFSGAILHYYCSQSVSASMHHHVTAAFCNVTSNATAGRVPMHHPVMMMCCRCVSPVCSCTISGKAK